MELITAQFSLLLILTAIVWGGFFSYLLYIFGRTNKLKKEVDSLEALEQDQRSHDKWQSQQQN